MSLAPGVRITDNWVAKSRDDLGEVEGRCFVQLLLPFEYRVGHADSPVVIVAPAGYVTDFASIPRVAWTLIGPPLGRHARAAIIHDWLYDTNGDWGRFSREQSDEIFLEAMEVVGVPWLKRSAMFRAVRAGGASGWKGPGEESPWIDRIDLSPMEPARA